MTMSDFRLNTLLGKYMCKKAILILISILVISCSSTVPIYDSNIAITEISELHSNANQFHAKPVKVHGYMVIEHERCVLWTSKEAFDKQSDLMEVLWLIYRDGTCYSVDKLKLKSQRKLVTLIGIYNKENYGHLGIYLGALQDFYEINN